MTNVQIAGTIDHTLLKPATKKEITKLCQEAITYGFASVCVNPCHVRLCARLLKGTNVKVCTVIGFPLGETLRESKAYEARVAVRDGATELDMVLNQSFAKSEKWKIAEKEISAVVKASNGNTVKVILETCNLSDKQIEKACQACVNAGANYVKTSTGFGKGGATLHHVELIAKCVHPYGLKVKASGGIHTRDEAVAMLNAGADRIGASCGVQIVTEN